MSTQTLPNQLPPGLEVLYAADVLQARIKAMAQEINQTYADTDGLVLICILKGGLMFMAELAKHLVIPCQMEFVTLSSYGNSQQTSGTVRPVDLSLPKLTGKDVLVVEDIIDTGLTLNFFLEYLNGLHTPKSLRLAVMLDKKEARQKQVKTDFVGFEIGNQFVVGFGLDDRGFYRNLPLIGYYPNPPAEA